MGFSKCIKNKPKGSKDFTRSDIIKYLDQFKKEESLDPTHKWIGTYNAHLVNIIRFFRWLYYPDLEPKKRPKPKVIQNLSKFTRREISDYKPADMWGPEHNLIFLKYCPSPRDRCYHAMEMDTGARPHELLKSRIKDIEFKEEAGIKYAEIVVNGKTGQRVIPLIDSLPYVIQWISLHPQGTNREAFLLPSETKAGGAIKVNAMTKAYEKYKKYFKSLLSSKNVIEEDKKRIRELLQKRWNTYTYRHSCLTEKSNILSDNQLRQFAGWTARSQMHHKYVHLSGGEATKNILKARGIIKEGKQSVDILQPKVCPNCRGSNRPDAQFCHKCSFVMSFEVYTKSIEERKKKDQEILDMKEQTDE